MSQTIDTCACCTDCSDTWHETRTLAHVQNTHQQVDGMKGITVESGGNVSLDGKSEQEILQGLESMTSGCELMMVKRRPPLCWRIGSWTHVDISDIGCREAKTETPSEKTDTMSVRLCEGRCSI